MLPPSSPIGRPQWVHERAGGAGDRRDKVIGLHIARQLAQRGLLVLIGSRDAERGRAAVAELTGEGLNVRLLILDVTDEAPEPRPRAGGRRSGAAGRLVNNAGITSGDAPTSQVQMSDLRRTHETNVFGVVAVTNAPLSLLRRSPAPTDRQRLQRAGLADADQRPVFPFAAANVAAYQSSKAALTALTVLYAKELREAGVKVNVVSPGYRATDLNGGRPTPGAGDPAEGATVAVEMALLDQDGPTGQFLSDRGTTYPW